MLEVLKNEKIAPIEIISCLKSIPLLKAFYETKVRHYTLEDHTMLVLGQFDKYFLNTDTVIPKNLFHLLLALHDIGKPKAYQEGNIHNQHRESIEIVTQIKHQLPFNSKAIDLCLAIISGDPIGGLFQCKITATKSASIILQMKSRSNLGIDPFFKILTIYYQCDAASYTKDGGGFRFLDHLFAYKDGIKILNV